jgi:predicted ester cyclase
VALRVPGGQAGFGQAFSDLQATGHDVIEDGDALVIRGENSAVHTCPFLGIDPTGRRVRWVTSTCTGHAPTAG